MTDKYLLKAQEIENFEGLQKNHFLNPNGKRQNKSLGDLTGLTGFGFHLVEVQPGDESTEYHFHHHEDECLYILSGTGVATIGEEKHDVGAGDFIGYRKGGLPHQLEATGDQPLRYIVVGERLDHDVCDYPKKRKRLYRNKSTGWDLVDMDAITTPNAGKK